MDDARIESQLANNQYAVWKIHPERAIRLDRPLCVGILNVTPDSFSDGGELGSVGAAVDRAKLIVDQGGDGLDIGGESTRPGAQRVGVEEQIRRVVPVIEGIRSAGIKLMVSVDTTRAQVAQAAIEAGADVVNDVSAGSEDEGMLDLVAERGCGLVLMHRVLAPELDRYSDEYADENSRGDQSSQRAPIDRNQDVVGCVIDGLQGALDRAVAAGVDRESVVLDPGLGFGKDVEQNLELIRSTGRLLELGHPVMSALSRKSFVGRVSHGRSGGESDPKDRLWGTLGLSVMHLERGARVFRVHDVGAHRQGLDAAWALMGSE